LRGPLEPTVTALRAAPEPAPATRAPAMRRDADELQGFLECLTAEISHPGIRSAAEGVLGAADLRSYPATVEGHHSYAGGLLEHTVGVATICREVAQLHPRLRTDLLLAAALVHD